MKKYCLTLDLKSDPELIAEYEKLHRQVWPEIQQSIADAGILEMEIYRFNNRLFLRMETSDDFTLEEKARLDLENEKVQEWEKLMWTFQQPVPGSMPGEKWVLMEKIFSLAPEAIK